MLAYVTLGTNKYDQAAAFYDALLSVLDTKRLWEGDHFILWGRSMDSTGIAIIKPHNGNPATVSNGGMTALAAPSRAVVDQLHAKALALGGQDEGAPGPRGAEGSNFYAAYFRDLDGNKLAAVCFAPA